MIGFMKPVKRPEESRRDEVSFELGPLDRKAQTHLHEQVAAEIRRAIAEGEAGPGQKIPQAKDLAAVLGVNTNTVLRALRLLRDEGLLEMGRGKAIRVTGTPDQGAVVAKTKDLIEFARSRGYRGNELSDLVQRLLHE
jgi:GntR family transcriptional regulator